MEMTLLKNNHTQIKIKQKAWCSPSSDYPHIIKSYIVLYGGKEIKRNSQFLYFEINADLINNRK